MLPVEELVDTGHGLEVLLRQPVVGSTGLDNQIPHDGNAKTDPPLNLCFHKCTSTGAGMAS